MTLKEGPLLQNTQSNVRVHRKREASLANHEGLLPRLLVLETPPPEHQLENTGVQMHQFDLLVQQLQNLTAAV